VQEVKEVEEVEEVEEKRIPRPHKARARDDLGVRLPGLEWDD